MKTRKKIKTQKNDISCLKKECQHLLQEKRNLTIQLKEYEDSIGTLKTLIDSILLEVVLKYGKDNKIEIGIPDVRKLEKCDVSAYKTDKYVIQVINKENKID